MFFDELSYKEEGGAKGKKEENFKKRYK